MFSNTEDICFPFQRRQRILPAFPSSGSANGWTTLINTAWVSALEYECLPFQGGAVSAACLCIPGYQLCDNSVGVLFNDYTRLIMYADGDSLQYIDKAAAESYLNVRSYPPALNKKVGKPASRFHRTHSPRPGVPRPRFVSPSQITLLKYFRNYMSEHLLKAGANIARREGDELARLPYLSLWFRTKSAIILHLSNGTVQINFFQVRLPPPPRGARG